MFTLFAVNDHDGGNWILDLHNFSKVSLSLLPTSNAHFFAKILIFVLNCSSYLGINLILRLGKVKSNTSHTLFSYFIIGLIRHGLSVASFWLIHLGLWVCKKMWSSLHLSLTLIATTIILVFVPMSHLSSSCYIWWPSAGRHWLGTDAQHMK